MNDESRIRRIGWLPVKERRDFHLLNLEHKALYSPKWPAYLQLVKIKQKRTLRSNQATRYNFHSIRKGHFSGCSSHSF